MGVDISGENEEHAVGGYFRNNWWWWRPFSKWVDEYQDTKGGSE